MGFRTNSYCKVWSVEPVSNTITKARISHSRKNRSTGQYEQDFGDFVSFFGTENAAKAAQLKEGDRIKLIDIDVTNLYDKVRQKTFVNYNIYSFEIDGAVEHDQVEPPQEVDDGEIDDSMLPF